MAAGVYEVSDFKKGLKVEIDGVPWVIVDFQHVKPGQQMIQAEHQQDRHQESCNRQKHRRDYTEGHEHSHQSS